MYYLGTDINEWLNTLILSIQKCKLDVLYLVAGSWLFPSFVLDEYQYYSFYINIEYEKSLVYCTGHNNIGLGLSHESGGCKRSGNQNLYLCYKG